MKSAASRIFNPEVVAVSTEHEITFWLQSEIPYGLLSHYKGACDRIEAERKALVAKDPSLVEGHEITHVTMESIRIQLAPFVVDVTGDLTKLHSRIHRILPKGEWPLENNPECFKLRCDALALLSVGAVLTLWGAFQGLTATTADEERVLGNSFAESDSEKG